MVLISAPIAGHKIPVWEQELSCGAAGMNLLLAAHALGYVGGWVTGWQAYSETVRALSARPASASRDSSSSAQSGRALEERPRPRWRRCGGRGRRRKPEIIDLNFSRLLYYDSMTLRTTHEKPVYVRLREIIADAILAGQL